MEGTFDALYSWMPDSSRLHSGLFGLRRKPSPVTIGSTAVWTSPDGQNGNLLVAQVAKLSQAATVQELSFYVTAASGNLILGIYDASGPSGGPGTLKASTASFAPKDGLGYRQGRHARRIGCWQLNLAGLSAEQQCGSQLRENQRDRQL